MAVELPSGLGGLIGLLGVRFPDANEDELNQLADQLDKFAGALDSAQMTADKALTMLHEVYHGSSADRLAELWSTITKYSKVIVEACQTVAKVLRAAAVAVELAKTQSITQLFSIQAQLAAASSTGPWSTAAVLRLGREIMNQLLQAAASKLADILTRPIEDMIDKAAQKIAPTPSNNSDGQGFSIDMAQLATCAGDLRRGADDIETHGTNFQRIVQSLKMGGSGDAFGKLAIAAAEKILRLIAEDVLKRILASFRDTAAKMDKMAGNLNENEDSNRTVLNSLSSSVANPFSPNSTLNSALGSPGSPRIGGGGGGGDAGLSAFAALAPKLGPVGGGSARGGGSNGVNTLGLREPNLKSTGGGHGGGAGGGGAEGGPAVPGQSAGSTGGFATRLALPGNGSGGSRGGTSRGTSLEGDQQHRDTPPGSGGPGGGSASTSTNGVAGRPVAGGMMGAMPMAGGYGPVGGSGIRGAQRRTGRTEDRESETGTGAGDGVLSGDPSMGAHAAMQFGRVMPVRQEAEHSERNRAYDHYEDDEDEDLGDLSEFGELGDLA